MSMRSRPFGAIKNLMTKYLTATSLFYLISAAASCLVTSWISMTPCQGQNSEIQVPEIYQQRLEAASADAKERIRTLQREGKEKGWSFPIAYTGVADRTIQDLTGGRPPTPEMIAAVPQINTQAAMAENATDELIIAGIRLEHDIGGSVAELMGGYLQTELLPEALRDLARQGLGKFGSLVSSDKEIIVVGAPHQLPEELVVRECQKIAFEASLKCSNGPVQKSTRLRCFLQFPLVLDIVRDCCRPTRRS